MLLLYKKKGRNRCPRLRDVHTGIRVQSTIGTGFRRLAIATYTYPISKVDLYTCMFLSLVNGGGVQIFTPNEIIFTTYGIIEPYKNNHKHFSIWSVIPSESR